MEAWRLILAGVLGYLLGCIPSGVLISNFYGQTDIRRTGSGNSGSTNVLRTLGWQPSVATLLCDVLKGAFAALLGRWLGGEIGMLVGALFSVLGHDFPVFFGFKGGKGIATSLGVTFVICWPVAPCLVGIVFLTVVITRLMSLGSLLASIAYPLLYLAFYPRTEHFAFVMVFAICLMLLSFFCHRSNIKRLFSGQENKLDFGRIDKLSKKHFRLFRNHMKKDK